MVSESTRTAEPNNFSPHLPKYAILWASMYPLRLEDPNWRGHGPHSALPSGQLQASVPAQTGIRNV